MRKIDITMPNGSMMCYQGSVLLDAEGNELKKAHLDKRDEQIAELRKESTEQKVKIARLNATLQNLETSGKAEITRLWDTVQKLEASLEQAMTAMGGVQGEISSGDRARQNGPNKVRGAIAFFPQAGSSPFPMVQPSPSPAASPTAKTVVEEELQPEPVSMTTD